MSSDEQWPVNPDDGIPDHWRAAFDRIDAMGGNPSANVLRAEAVMLLDRMKWQRFIFHAQAERAAREATDAQQRHREAQDSAKVASDAATAHASALTRATWVLAIATAVLAIATVVLVIVTASEGG